MKYAWWAMVLNLILAGCGLQSLSSNHKASQDIWANLVEGNQRYMRDHPKHPHQSLKRIKELNSGQHPFAVIVSCSDSRVPPELIFDQGLGDLFVIRTAGNVIGDFELGSIEYAVEHLGANLIVVLGHDGCGAVSAFIEHKHERLNNHIQNIIDYLKDEPEEKSINEQTPNFWQNVSKQMLSMGYMSSATPNLL